MPSEISAPDFIITEPEILSVRVWRFCEHGNLFHQCSICFESTYEMLSEEGKI